MVVPFELSFLYCGEEVVMDTNGIWDLFAYFFIGNVV